MSKSRMQTALFLSGALLVAAIASSSPGIAADNSFATSDNWSGPYVGAHIGGNWGEIDGIGAIGGINASDYNSGVTGGLLAGWNFQTGNWVYGLEADLSASDIDGNINVLGVNVTEDLQWSGNLRARLGRLLTPNALLFVASGLAIADYDIKTNSPIAGNDTATFIGWTVGTGVEMYMTDNARARVEYLYTDYGSETMFTSVGGVSISPVIQTLRAAIIVDLDALQ